MEHVTLAGSSAMAVDTEGMKEQLANRISCKDSNSRCSVDAVSDSRSYSSFNPTICMVK